MDREAALRRRRVRVARGAASAAIATLLAAAAHTLSGGAAPLWLLATTTLLVLPVAVWLVGRRPSLWRTALVVSASQALFHTFFSIAGTADPAAAGIHLHAGGTLPALGPGAAGAMHHAGGPSIAMIATHLVAAAVTTLLLAQGERMLAALARGIRSLVRRLAGILPGARPRLDPATFDDRTPITARVYAALSSRGPPVASV